MRLCAGCYLKNAMQYKKQHKTVKLNGHNNEHLLYYRTYEPKMYFTFIPKSARYVDFRVLCCECHIDHWIPLATVTQL